MGAPVPRAKLAGGAAAASSAVSRHEKKPGRHSGCAARRRSLPHPAGIRSGINEVRALKNWRGGRGKYGRTITGLTRSAGISAHFTGPISRRIWKSKRNQRRGSRDKKHRWLYSLAQPAFYESQAGRGGRRHRRIVTHPAAQLPLFTSTASGDEVGPGAYARVPGARDCWHDLQFAHRYGKRCYQQSGRCVRRECRG